MSDSLFTCLCTATLYWAMRAWGLLRCEGDDAAIKKQSAWWLAAAVLCGGLATLTRYQGVLLVPPIAMVAVAFIRRFRTLPWVAQVPKLVWLLVPLWMWKNGFVHQQQFADRAGVTFWQTFLAWWNTLESFVLISPYYFGYPVFIAALFGIPYVKKAAKPWLARPAALLWGSFAVLLLGLQAAFGSFQYRYMLPLLPMVTVLAGVGFARFYDRFGESRPWLPRWAFILSVIYLGFFTLSVRFLQSGRAFQDQKEAGLYIKKEIPAETKVYSNERYGNFTKLGSVKLSFWSGRPVQLLESPDQALEPGSLVVLGNAYGGNEAVAAWMDGLGKHYNLEAMRPEPFRTTLVPLLDDIMVNPMYNQNPMGWVMRYVPQNFATQIFRITPKGGTDGR